MVVSKRASSFVASTRVDSDCDVSPVSHQWPFIESEVRRILGSCHIFSSGSEVVLCDSKVTKWLRVLSTLHSRMGRMSAGNQIMVCGSGMLPHYITNHSLGDIAACEMIKAIDEAVERVLMEVYIFDDSRLAARFVTALVNASRRGCRVTLVVDYVGSFKFPSLYLNELTKYGVEVLTFNPVTDRNLAVGTFPFRNHKKVLIVDNRIAFCGSMNISADSTTPMMGGNGNFYDVNIRACGPVVCDFVDIFKRTLEMTDYDISNIRCTPATPIEGGVIVQVLESDVSRIRRRTGIQSYLSTLISNVGCLHIYLVMLTLLCMFLGSFSYVFIDALTVTQKRISEQTLHKFKVFMTTQEHCHGKYMIVDDLWSSVGSFNWDRWSSRRNLEVSVSVFDPITALQLKSLQQKKEKKSIEYTKQDCLNRPIMLKCFDALIHKLIRFSSRNCFDGLSSAEFKAKFKKAFIRTFIDDNASQIVAISNMASV
uniref:Phospholipase D active site motif family protein n=1 Tax=Babesia bovis TaxID=5865 RepID=A7AT95_BABBO|eukprot:XP_001609724.1 phospholipase D active site motif family protein [Babesia bovis T2Bo]